MKIFYKALHMLAACLIISAQAEGQAPPIQAHAYPDTVCPGQQVMLWATTVVQCGAAIIPCSSAAPAVVQVGTGNTTVTSSFTYPSPFGNFLKSARHEYLFKGPELAAVSGPGQITAIAMDVGTAGSGSTLNNFTVMMGCAPTPLDSLTGYVPAAWLTSVYVANYTPGNNWNTLNLQIPYNWDGVSDLIIDFCFSDITANNINPSMVCTPTAFRSVWFTASNGADQCGVTGTVPTPAQTTPGTPYLDRPNFRFTICKPNLDSAKLVWVPSTGPNGVTIPNTDTTFSHPINQTTYTVTLTDTVDGTTSTSSIVVYVDTNVQLSVTPDTFICSISPVTLQANLILSNGTTVNPNNVTYTWTTDPPTATAPPSGTGPAFADPTVNPTGNTTYICKISGTGFCTLTDSATVTIGTGIPVNATVDSISCATSADGKIVIDMTQGTPPYTYSWTPPEGNTGSIMNLGPGTYSVLVTDASGCKGRDTFTLAAPPALTLTLDSTNILCFGYLTGTAGAIVTGGRKPYRYTWNPAEANTANLSSLPAGAYTLTVTDTSGCTISGAVNITQPPQLVSSAASTNLSGYNTDDGTITLTTTGGTGGYTYSSVPNANGLPNATGLDTGHYYITVCDANHCCVIDTAVIKEPPPIFITFVTVNNLCAGQCNGKATASATGGVLPYTYSWNTVPAGPNVLSTTDSITGLCAGVYSITVRDANGLAVSKDTTITAPPPLGMAIDSTPITCYNANNGKLNDSVYGGTAPYTITWTPGGSNPLSNLDSGTYIVNVTDHNGCVAADTAYLGEPAPVIATIISTDSATCFGFNDGYANVAATGGRPPYTYQWSGSATTDSFASDLLAGSQTVTVTDHSGCTASAAFSIGQPTLVVIAPVDTTASHCPTSHDGSAVATVSGGTPPYTYKWGSGSPGTDSSATGLAPGTYTLSVTDSKGCGQSVPYTIGINYVLAVTLASDSVTCNGYSNGAAFITSLNGTPTYTYSWSPSGSTTDSATGLAAGTQTLTVTDLYGCTATAGVAVGQPGPISDQPYFADPLCTGQSNGKVWVTAGGTTGPYTYTFNSAVYAITDTVFNLSAGTYYFTVTDGHGCNKGDSVTLTNPTPLTVPAPAVVGISCANEANGVISVNPAGGTPPYSYSWSPGGYTTNTADSLGPATYTITVTDANGCNQSVSVKLIAPPLITFTSIESDSTSCPDSADGHIVVGATGGTPGDIVLYQYSINGGPYQTNPNFYDLPAGTYLISVMDSPGCTLDSNITVYQPLPVAVTINPGDSLIALGGTITLYPAISDPGGESINSYGWSPAAGLNCIDCPTPAASPYQTTQYALLLNYGKNCTTTAISTVQVGPGPQPYIPNAFTPNGDNINDVFEVFGTTLQAVGMKIFDRWGEKVFDSGDSQWATWDGTYRGVMQQPGVYVYYIEFLYLNGTRESKEGSVTLIR
jgi:gliding motility-associated-like protein